MRTKAIENQCVKVAFRAKTMVFRRESVKQPILSDSIWEIRVFCETEGVRL